MRLQVGELRLQFRRINRWVMEMRVPQGIVVIRFTLSDPAFVVHGIFGQKVTRLLWEVSFDEGDFDEIIRQQILDVGGSWAL